MCNLNLNELMYDLVANLWLDTLDMLHSSQEDDDKKQSAQKTSPDDEDERGANK